MKKIKSEIVTTWIFKDRVTTKFLNAIQKAGILFQLGNVDSDGFQEIDLKEVEIQKFNEIRRVWGY